MIMLLSVGMQSMAVKTITLNKTLKLLCLAGCHLTCARLLAQVPAAAPYVQSEPLMYRSSISKRHFVQNTR